MANQQELNGISSIIDALAAAAARVARFSYTQSAYDAVRGVNSNGVPVAQDLTMANGTAEFSIEEDQNIPLADPTGNGSNKIDVSMNILDKGIRASGASISRGFANHFTGRVSFNLNMIVDMLVRLMAYLKGMAARNANEYDSSATYLPGDMAFLVTVAGNHTLYQWYRRTSADPGGTTGVLPTDTTRWELMKEYTSMAHPIVNAATTNLNTFTTSGLYSFVSPGSQIVIQNMPPLPANFANTFMLTVKSSLASSDIIIQEVHFRDSGEEWTRTFSIESGTFSLKQDWYKTRDPVGLNVVGVPGLYAFRVQPDGHLYLYYDDPNPPDLWINKDSSSPTYGHLYWGDENLLPYMGPSQFSGIIPASHYNNIMAHDGAEAPPRYIAFGHCIESYNGRMDVQAYTSDGQTWEMMAVPSAIAETASVSASDPVSTAYGNGILMLCIMSHDSTVGADSLFTSSDKGVTWVKNTQIMDIQYGKVFFLNGQFVLCESIQPDPAVYAFRTRLRTSTDGVTWSNEIPLTFSGKSTSRITDLVYAYGVYFAHTYDNSKSICVSTNLSNWAFSAGSPNIESSSYRHMFCVGAVCFVVYATGIVYSSDAGTTWNSITGNGTVLPSISIVGAAYGNGLFVATGSAAGAWATLTSSDGMSWTVNNAPTFGINGTRPVFVSGSFVNSRGGDIYRSSNGIDGTICEVESSLYVESMIIPVIQEIV